MLDEQGAYAESAYLACEAAIRLRPTDSGNHLLPVEIDHLSLSACPVWMLTIVTPLSRSS